MGDEIVTLVCDIRVVDDIRVDIETLIREVGTLSTFDDYGFTIERSDTHEDVGILQVFSHSHLLLKRKPLVYKGYRGVNVHRKMCEMKAFYAAQALELYIVMVIGLSAYEDQAAHIVDLTEQLKGLAPSDPQSVKHYQTVAGIH